MYFDKIIIAVKPEEDERVLRTDKHLVAGLRFLHENYPEIMYSATRKLCRRIIDMQDDRDFETTLSSSSRIAKMYEETRGFITDEGDRIIKPSVEQLEALLVEMRPVRLRRLDKNFTILGNETEGFKVAENFDEIEKTMEARTVIYAINVVHNGYLPKATWPVKEREKLELHEGENPARYVAVNNNNNAVYVVNADGNFYANANGEPNF